MNPWESRVLVSPLIFIKWAISTGWYSALSKVWDKYTVVSFCFIFISHFWSTLCDLLFRWFFRHGSIFVWFLLLSCVPVHINVLDNGTCLVWDAVINVGSLKAATSIGSRVGRLRCSFLDMLMKWSSRDRLWDGEVVWTLYQHVYMLLYWYSRGVLCRNEWYAGIGGGEDCVWMRGEEYLLDKIYLILVLGCTRLIALSALELYRLGFWPGVSVEIRYDTIGGGTWYKCIFFVLPFPFPFILILFGLFVNLLNHNVCSIIN